jgi:hypothetical protein
LPIKEEEKTTTGNRTERNWRKTFPKYTKKSTRRQPYDRRPPSKSSLGNKANALKPSYKNTLKQLLTEIET